MGIVVSLEQLSTEQERELRSWLGKSSRQTLIRVADAQVKRYQADALRDLVAMKDFDGKQAAAEVNIKKAQRYATFIDVLEELTAQNEPHTTARLS